MRLPWFLVVPAGSCGILLPEAEVSGSDFGVLYGMQIPFSRPEHRHPTRKEWPPSSTTPAVDRVCAPWKIRPRPPHREAVLAAARERLAEGGLDCPMEDIARRRGRCRHGVSPLSDPGDLIAALSATASSASRSAPSRRFARAIRGRRCGLIRHSAASRCGTAPVEFLAGSGWVTAKPSGVASPTSPRTADGEGPASGRDAGGRGGRGRPDPPLRPWRGHRGASGTMPELNWGGATSGSCSMAYARRAATSSAARAHISR